MAMANENNENDEKRKRELLAWWEEQMAPGTRAWKHQVVVKHFMDLNEKMEKYLNDKGIKIPPNISKEECDKLMSHDAYYNQMRKRFDQFDEMFRIMLTDNCVNDEAENK